MKKGTRAYEDLILELRRFARATIDSIKDKPKGLQPRLNKFVANGAFHLTTGVLLQAQVGGSTRPALLGLDWRDVGRGH